MGFRLSRRTNRRRSPRVRDVQAPSSSVGVFSDETASLSCPAPFCPAGWSEKCQPEAAVPADCEQKKLCDAPVPGRPGRTHHDVCQHGKLRSTPSCDAVSDQSNAFWAWKMDGVSIVNKFTNKKYAGRDSNTHPLAQMARQWQQQQQQAARRIRETGLCAAAPEENVKGATTSSPLPFSTSELKSSVTTFRPEDDGRTPSWRQAGREELHAWRRSVRRPSLSSILPAQEISFSERRLNKVIAEAGCCSRRKADELIFAGRVCVNGAVETHAGRRIGPNDHVSVDGKLLSLSQQKLYIMLHKPVQVVSTAADPQGRQTVLSLVAHEYPEMRLFPVGRLDYFSEGLILLTNDGRLAQRLMHPRHHLPKLYEVLVRNVVTQKAMQCMRSGMRLAEGEELLPVDVTARSTSSGCTLLRMVLRQGVNRQIRRMCRDLGLTILRLRRVAIGPLQLGQLAPGQYRPLEEAELVALRQAVGLR